MRTALAQVAVTEWIAVAHGEGADIRNEVPPIQNHGCKSVCRVCIAL